MNGPTHAIRPSNAAMLSMCGAVSQPTDGSDRQTRIDALGEVVLGAVRNETGETDG
jgi:hypothetical protein